MYSQGGQEESRRSTAAVYTICIAGAIDPCWSSWLEGFVVMPGGGVTFIVGEVLDQAALHGLLARIRDMNLVLLSVERQD